MRVLESTGVERPVINYARDVLGILVTKMNIMGRRGMPDDVFWIFGGRPLIIEFKAPGEEPRKLQQITIDYLRNIGYDVQVVDDATAGIRLLKERVEAAQVSKARSKVPARTRGSRTLPRSRTR